MDNRKQMLFLSGESYNKKESLNEMSFWDSKKEKEEPKKTPSGSVILEKQGEEDYRLFINHKLVDNGDLDLDHVLNLLSKEGIIKYTFREID